MLAELIVGVATRLDSETFAGFDFERVVIPEDGVDGLVLACDELDRYATFIGHAREPIRDAMSLCWNRGNAAERRDSADEAQLHFARSVKAREAKEDIDAIAAEMQLPKRYARVRPFANCDLIPDEDWLSTRASRDAIDRNL